MHVFHTQSEMYERKNLDQESNPGLPTCHAGALTAELFQVDTRNGARFYHIPKSSEFEMCESISTKHGIRAQIGRSDI